MVFMVSVGLDHVLSHGLDRADPTSALPIVLDRGWNQENDSGYSLVGLFALLPFLSNQTPCSTYLRHYAFRSSSTWMVPAKNAPMLKWEFDIRHLVLLIRYDDVLDS